MFGIEQPVVDAVIADWRTAPIHSRLQAIFALLERMTERPAELCPEDFTPALDLGLDGLAIAEALRPCFSFSVVNRMVDAFDGRHPSVELQRRATKMLHLMGATSPSRLVWGMPQDGTPTRNRMVPVQLREDAYSQRADALLRHVLHVVGVTALDERECVSQKVLGEMGFGPALVLPNEYLDRYVHKVALYAYKVTDEDIAALVTEGLSEEAIWELTMVASVTAGVRRYVNAMQQLDAALATRSSFKR